MLDLRRKIILLLLIPLLGLAGLAAQRAFDDIGELAQTRRIADVVELAGRLGPTCSPPRAVGGRCTGPGACVDGAYCGSEPGEGACEAVVCDQLFFIEI